MVTVKSIDDFEGLIASSAEVNELRAIRKRRRRPDVVVFVVVVSAVEIGKSATPSLARSARTRNTLSRIYTGLIIRREYINKHSAGLVVVSWEMNAIWRGGMKIRSLAGSQDRERVR